jgi:glutathione reductase (NADPH)
MREFDLFIIGAGSGGVRAARLAAKKGMRVAIAEESEVGGTCVIRGCIPKKLLSYAAHYREDLEDAWAYGWNIEQRSFDWPRLIAHKDREIARLNGIYKRLLAESGVTLFEARARLGSEPHQVEIEGEQPVSTAQVIIATGARPFLPDLPGIEHAITSNEVFHLPSLPKRVAIIGGGYIAVEFAGIFNGLGAQVTELYRGTQILRGFDKDLRDFLAAEMRKKGVDIRTEREVMAIDRRDEVRCLRLDDGTTLEAECVLYATGRIPNTTGIGLVEAGVQLDEIGAVKVDEYSMSAVPWIHAIGDCTNRLNLTPVAIREGAALVATLYGDTPIRVDYADVPSAIFAQPQAATVGLSEEEARKNTQVIVYKTDFRPLKLTMTERTERTFMKLVVDRHSRRVLGVHMVGADAAEIIQAVAVAVKMGATKEDFDRTVALHPSAAEEFVTMPN